MIQIVTDPLTKTGTLYATGDKKSVGLELSILLDQLYKDFPDSTISAIEVFLETINEKMNS